MKNIPLLIKTRKIYSKLVNNPFESGVRVELDTDYTRSPNPQTPPAQEEEC